MRSDRQRQLETAVLVQGDRQLMRRAGTDTRDAPRTGRRCAYCVWGGDVSGVAVASDSVRPDQNTTVAGDMDSLEETGNEGIQRDGAAGWD